MFPRTKVGMIAQVKGGKRLPLDEELVTYQTDHPYIRARDIRDGRITFDDPVYITDHVFEKIRRYTVNAGDVCVVIVGANVGDVGTVPQSLNGANLTENAAKLVNLGDDFDSVFLVAEVGEKMGSDLDSFDPQPAVSVRQFYYWRNDYLKRTGKLERKNNRTSHA